MKVGYVSVLIFFANIAIVLSIIASQTGWYLSQPNIMFGLIVSIVFSLPQILLYKKQKKNTDKFVFLVPFVLLLCHVCFFLFYKVIRYMAFAG